MMLRQLSLVNFRSYTEAELHFNTQVVLFTGVNGSGKTNLLDAIHYLAFCKSFLNPIDTQNIHEDAPFFVIQGRFSSEDAEDQIYCGLKRGQKKVFKRNGKEYEKLSAHIGLIPLVTISPADISLIHGGSEERRKFIDSVISQYDADYLQHLIRYSRLIQQRNALLRLNPDPELLNILDEQIIPEGESIYQVRMQFMERFRPQFQKHYSALSGGKEVAELSYKSSLDAAVFADVLRAAREKDLSLQYSSAGVHKDDLGMAIDGYPLRKFASQGQTKSFLIALKLAELDLLKSITNKEPLLLLDDIFEKLDQERIKALMQLVSDGGAGQLFITDAHPERAAELLNGIQINFEHYRIENGITEKI